VGATEPVDGFAIGRRGRAAAARPVVVATMAVLLVGATPPAVAKIVHMR
jgi:hypothetical protein